MKAGFAEFESEIIYLEETEETGRSKLELHCLTNENISIKNLDGKNTQLQFFQTDSMKSMHKRVDHIVFQHLSDNDWKIHLIEMKSSVGVKKWTEIKGKFRASYLLAQGIAAMLEMNIVDTCMYTTYENVNLRLPETAPAVRRLGLGLEHVRPEEEWNSEKFALNFGRRITFMHRPIEMARDEDNILVGIFLFSPIDNLSQ